MTTLFEFKIQDTDNEALKKYSADHHRRQLVAALVLVVAVAHVLLDELVAIHR